MCIYMYVYLCMYTHICIFYTPLLEQCAEFGENQGCWIEIGLKSVSSKCLNTEQIKMELSK